ALDRGIARIVDSKNNFVFRVILQAVAAKALVDFRIDSLQRLQDRNRRQRLCGAGALARRLPAQKCRSTPQAQQVINGTGENSEGREDLKQCEDRVNHAVRSSGLQYPGRGKTDEDRPERSRRDGGAIYS